MPKSLQLVGVQTMNGRSACVHKNEALALSFCCRFQSNEFYGLYLIMIYYKYNNLPVIVQLY